MFYISKLLLNMRDRIKLIMEKENLTPAQFADRLGIGRAVVSHILNGRNNPSLDVVTKILSEMDYINSEWLIMGEGNMFKDGYKEKNTLPEDDLFSQQSIIQDNQQGVGDIFEGNDVKSDDKSGHVSDYVRLNAIRQHNKRIAQIIIYFSDNTFEVFRPTN
jgi:transcriptional regulator with XRE-family HTH domain